MKEKNKIPKILHYCWFGNGEKPLLVRKCMKSWEKYLPDYKIIEWNEQNFDIHINSYVEEAYKAKKWAFVTDFARLFVIYNYGGIYMDTDVEVLKPLDIFLCHEAFSGFEARDSVPTGIIAGIKGQKVIGDLLRHYNDLHFIKDDGSVDLTTNVETITKYFIDYGISLNNKKQEINGMTMYSQVIFCPNSFYQIFGKASSKSFTIHHFDSSWLDNRKKKNMMYRIRFFLIGILRNIIGTKQLKKLKKLKK